MERDLKVFSDWPFFDDEQVEAVSNVLRSGKINYWTGQQGRMFEREFAEYMGCKYGIAVSNGTVALELALYSLGIGTGDEVVTTSRTFIATVSSIVRCNAIPVFADVDLDSQNITLDSIRSVVTSKTKAIIVVHLAGWPCEMDKIMDFAKGKGIKVIEDCAQAHGATYNDKPVGGFGDIATFSFCQDKIMTTGGEGGMVTTNDEALWSVVWSHKDHGKSWNAVYEREHPTGFKWLHDSFGTNARMTEMQAVLGRIQLKHLPKWVKKRQINAKKIWGVAREIPALRVPEIPNNIGHASYKCYFFVRPERLRPTWGRDRIMAEINRRGIPCYSGACSEVYRETAFKVTGYRPTSRLKNAKVLGETALMFLVHPTLTEENLGDTCDIIQSVMKIASI